MNTKIWLSSPHMGGNELSFINEAFQSNWIAPLGPNVNGFEEDISSYLEKDSSVACLSSGTSAIHLALVMADVTLGDEVICQSMTFSASANPIIYQGAIPVFVDSEEETWNMCPNHLENAIKDRISKGKKPKAIIVVHLYGMPAKIDQIKKIALNYNIVLIEDSAEAFGSSYKGQKCGTFSNYGVLSFNGNKIITTSGGGALVCNTKADKNQTVFLATQARDNAPHYQHSQIGYNYRMSNITAGIGRGQMQVLDKHIGLRRANNSFYKSIFKDVKGVTVFTEPSSDYYSNHWLSCILFNDTSKISAETLRLALEKENIESRPLWKPMHLQPIFSKYPYFGDKVSENLFLNGLCLPSGSNLTDSDRERIHKTIVSAFK
ncbi:DegT/DnrJ/EryC1/StrS family aminotransferase [Aurantibacter sp.]|uniref:DegT/DnrJ/EryC1/StrS family aminotransferase n=1 Tax=Aurantibacter sp. TaxID=2807103 RepID=UPI0035C80000